MEETFHNDQIRATLASVFPQITVYISETPVVTILVQVPRSPEIRDEYPILLRHKAPKPRRVRGTRQTVSPESGNVVE